MYSLAQRTRARRSLGGITSQPPPAPRSMFALSGIAGRKGGSRSGRVRQALGGITSQPPPRPRSMFALGATPDWYRAMSGPPDWYRAMGSLGDDAPSPTTLSTPTITDSTAQWQGAVLANQQAMLKQLQGDHLQKWVQIAVTASIPLFGAIWKLIFGAAKE